MSVVASHTHVTAARALAAAGALQAAIYLFLGFENFESAMRVPLALWIAAPLALTYWIGTRVALTVVAFRIVLTAMALAFAVSVWAYYEITWGETARTESLAGLLFLFGPLYQYGLLVPALVVAWFVSRRARAG